MDKYSDNGVMRFNAPVPPALRVIFVALGIFIATITIYELGRGVWPLNITSPLFLFIILSAIGIAAAIVKGAIFGWDSDWTIRRGEIVIDQRNPFNKRTIRYGKSDILRFDIAEVESSEGPNDWAVMLRLIHDRPVEMRRLQTLKGAEEFRAEVERAYSGQDSH